MYTFRQLNDSLQGHVDELGPGRGHQAFVREVHEAVGLLERNESGDLVESFDEDGSRRLAPGRVSPNEFSLARMAEAVGGRDFLESFNPESPSGSDAVNLLEAGPGVDPTAFLNTNTFSAAVGGLIEAQVLENFQNNTFIGDQLFETIPTNKNGERMPGTHGFGADEGDTSRKPGMPHPRAQFGERWVQTPELDEKALACEVTQEAVFYDLTNEVLTRAADVGGILGYGREKTQLRLFAGASNSYNYNGVGYDTYQASAPWVNTLSNAIGTNGSFLNVDAALELFEDMTDPETGREILIDADTIVHMPRKQSSWHFVLNSTEQRTGQSGTSTTQTLSTPPPSTNSNYNLLSSTILRNIVRDELTSGNKANAQEYWWIGQPRRCFKWMEAWPVRVRQASPQEFVMQDRGLVAAYFANYRGVGAVVEPRYVVRNTN